MGSEKNRIKNLTKAARRKIYADKFRLLKLHKSGLIDNKPAEPVIEYPDGSEDWLSCQIDINKLVKPNNLIDEKILSTKSILPTEANDVAETKNILPAQADEWVLEQTLCRCCHAEGVFSSLQDTALSEHITYNDMLSTCFNIQLFPVSSGLGAALGAVCELCAARLRDAYSFSELVRASEARLLHLYQRNCIKVSTDEIEVNEEAPLTINEVSTDEEVEEEATHTINEAPQSTPRQKSAPVLPAVYCTLIGDSYKCTRCEKIYNNRHGVREHFKIIHLKLTRAFECTHCSNTFKTDIRLTIHKLEAHNINEQVKCKACDRTFNTQKQLSSHLDTYHMMGERIKCTICDYECYGKITLRKHLVKHKKTKEHRCKYCKKCFLRSTNLKLHERIHTGDKRKACAECGHAFVQKASLNYHMAKHHPEVKF